MASRDPAVQPPGASDRGVPTSSIASERVRQRVDRFPFLDRELFLIPDLVPPGGVMVDVGAAGGAHAIAAARAAGPGGRVLAVEPRPGSAAVLRGWGRLLRLRQLTVLPLGLADEPGTLDLRTPLVPTRSHAAGGDDGTRLARLPAIRRQLPVTTLDIVVTDHDLVRLDLLKVDVEGGEARVLTGGRETIERFRPAIIIELHDPYLQRDGTSVAAIHTWLAQRGYVAHVDGPRGPEPVAEPSAATQNHLYLPTS